MLTVERVAMKGSESLRSANQFSASSSPTSVESITSNVKKIRSEREGEVQPVVVVAAAAAAAAAEGLTMENLRKHSTVAVVREDSLENGGARHRPVGTRRHTTGETKPGGISRRSPARSTQQRSRLFPLESSDNKTRVSMVASDAPMVARDAPAVMVGSPVVGGNGARQRRASQFLNDGSMKASESATAEIKKMRESLLIKREMKRKQRHFLDDDRVLVGNKVSEGHVNFIIAYNMLTGIRVAVSRCSGIMKPLVQKDFHHTKKLAFDYHGNELTPSSQYAFKFKDYCPEVFRELRARFGLDPADYLMSLTSKYILSELNSPGKSGSFFYFSRDYKYIIKTIHHSEHKHLRRVLQDYYHHVKNNPDTLVCQFYGLHRVKMPISFKNKVKSRRIYFIVMNNLFPPHVELNVTFDLKGSTLGRYTKVNKEDEDARPVLKDLNWLEQDMKIRFGPLKGQRFLNQLKKDVEFLTRLNIMDYSLLLGIQETDAAAQNSSEDIHAMIPELSAKHATMYHTSSNGKSGLNSYYPTNTNTSRATAGHFFQRDEGGIRASDSDNNELNIVYYIGIIDCLTNYSLLKKLETFWRGLSHDLHAVSAVPPFDYGQRFYKFIEDSVTMGKPRAKLE